MGYIVVGAWTVAVVMGVLAAARTVEEVGDGPHAPGNKALDRFRLAGIAAIVVLLALSFVGSPPLLMGLFGLVVLVLFAREWVREFSFLMALRDEDFPGRFDKPIWAFLLIASGPVGLWLFHSFRASHWPAPAAEATDPRRSAKPAPAADLL